MADARVKDLMTNLVVMLYPQDTVQEAARRLSRNRISGAPVVDGGKVVGMISESDLIAVGMAPEVDRGTSVLEALSVVAAGRARPHAHGKTVGEVMSPMVIWTSPDASILSAARTMERRGIKRLPVVDDEGYLLGIISRADLVRSMAKGDEEIEKDLRDALRVLGDDVFEDLKVEVKEGVARLSGTADRKSTRDIAERIATQAAGVIEVVDRLHFAWDDTKFRVGSVDLDPRSNWNQRLSAEAAEAL